MNYFLQNIEFKTLNIDSQISENFTNFPCPVGFPLVTQKLQRL